MGDDWAHFGKGIAREFADFLVSLEAKSIVVDSDKIWLALRAKESGNVIMLREPKKLSKTEKDYVKSFKVDSLEQFCENFFDMHEDVSPYVNATKMSASPFSSECFHNCGPWEHGLFLYYICCGDAMLLAKDGTIGRWYHSGFSVEVAGYGSCSVDDLEIDFEQFVKKYIEYLRTDFDLKKQSIFW